LRASVNWGSSPEGLGGLLYAFVLALSCVNQRTAVNLVWLPVADQRVQVRAFGVVDGIELEPLLRRLGAISRVARAVASLRTGDLLDRELEGTHRACVRTGPKRVVVEELHRPLCSSR